MAEGLGLQPNLTDVLQQLSFLQSPAQAVGGSAQGLPEPAAPDIAGALLQAMRMLFGQQFLTSRTEVPPTMEEQLGLMGPHAGLTGLGKTGMADTLRAFMQNYRGKNVPLPMGKLEPSLAEAIRTIMREHPTGLPMPKTTTLEQAMNAARGTGDRPPWTQAPGFGQAIAARKPVSGLAAEELEGALTYIARLPVREQRILAESPELLGAALGQAAASSANLGTQPGNFLEQPKYFPAMHRNLLDLWASIRRSAARQ